MQRALFVDDHAEFWLTPTEAAVPTTLSHIVDTQQHWGLDLNWDKIQMLIQPMGTGRRRRFPNCGNLHYNGKSISGTRPAKYIGALISRTGSCRVEVTSRIRKATAALTKTARHVWNQRMTLALKVQLYVALVRSVLCFGLECWHLTASHYRELEQFQNRALRWLAKAPAHKTHESNESLRTRLQVPTVESWLRLRRLKWLQDCTRAPEHRAQALCALFAQLTGTPPRPPPPLRPLVE